MEHKWHEKSHVKKQKVQWYVKEGRSGFRWRKNVASDRGWSEGITLVWTTGRGGREMVEESGGQGQGSRGTGAGTG